MKIVNAEGIAERYQHLLTEEGFKIEESIKEEGGSLQLVVKFESFYFVIIFDSEDYQFIRIIVPNFFKLDSDDERLNALVAINHVAQLCKAVKVFMNADQDNVMATSEYLEDGSSEDFKYVLRYFRMLQYAAGEFMKKMNDLSK
jgi:hypothetical protein